MEVDVQVQRIAEALHEGDGAALEAPAAIDAEPGPPPQRGKDAAEEALEHLARERGPGEAIAQGKGQGEHPLPDGYPRHDAVHQVRRGVGHAASPARGTEAAPFARERHQTLAGGSVAAHAHEAVREDPAREKGV
jgi:hypothetical protein